MKLQFELHIILDQRKWNHFVESFHIVQVWESTSISYFNPTDSSEASFICFSKKATRLSALDIDVGFVLLPILWRWFSSMAIKNTEETSRLIETHRWCCYIGILSCKQLESKSYFHSTSPPLHWHHGTFISRLWESENFLINNWLFQDYPHSMVDGTVLFWFNYTDQVSIFPRL